MSQDIILRKRSRDGNRVCTSYGISDPSYKFTFETCDDIEAIIKDSKNNIVTILSPNAPTAIISKKGNYNICIEGIGIGTLYAEWTQGGGGEECCDELREKDIELQNQINNLRTRLDNQNITGGTGISVTKTGDSYTITNTGGGGGGGLPDDFDIRGGSNVQVSKSGNVFTVSSTDTNTVTTLTAGSGVTITDSGTGGNHNYKIDAEKPVLNQAINVTCDIGGIPSGTTYPAGTSLENILRALLTCTTPPTPVGDYLLFTSEITDMSTWNEIWNELRADEDLGEYIINLADTYEEHPVKFDVPANMPITDVQLYNKITAEWVTARDFDTENITRTIDGVSVPYVRYTDNRELNGIGRPVKLIWTV